MSVMVLARRWPGGSPPAHGATERWEIEMSKPDDQMFDLQWETTVRHSLSLTRAQIREALGHEPEELAHQPIIDADLYPGEPMMDGSRFELAEALGRLESDDPQRDGHTNDGVSYRVIRWVEEA